MNKQELEKLVGMVRQMGFDMAEATDEAVGAYLRRALGISPHADGSVAFAQQDYGQALAALNLILSHESGGLVVDHDEVPHGTEAAISINWMEYAPDGTRLQITARGNVDPLLIHQATLNAYKARVLNRWMGFSTEPVRAPAPQLKNQHVPKKQPPADKDIPFGGPPPVKRNPDGTRGRVPMKDEGPAGARGVPAPDPGGDGTTFQVYGVDEPMVVGGVYPMYVSSVAMQSDGTRTYVAFWNDQSQYPILRVPGFQFDDLEDETGIDIGGLSLSKNSFSAHLGVQIGVNKNGDPKLKKNGQPYINYVPGGYSPAD
jgi:hypothetical protein